jgi:hypothetical protein
VPATSSDYISVAQLKGALRISNESSDDELQMAVTASSRQIDNWYGDQFWTGDAPSARVLRADTMTHVKPGVFATTDGLVVATDDDGDGVFENTWDPSMWEAAPFSPMFGYPFDRIEAVGGLFFPAPKRRSHRLPFGCGGYGGYEYGYGDWDYGAGYGARRTARVQVTAQWGWAAVPVEVSQACQILAIDHYKSKDFTNGSAGISGLATGSFGGQKTVMVVQAPFNPLAVKLLCHLKDPVLA